MGLLDGAGSIFEKGSAGISRAAKNYTLDAQIKDLEKQRQTILARLGAVFFESFRLDPETRAPNEALFSSVEDLDRQINQLKFEQKALERQRSIASSKAICNKCGAEVSSGDVFCTKCGERIALQFQGEQEGEKCPKCGMSIDENNLFCTYCGMKVN